MPHYKWNIDSGINKGVASGSKSGTNKRDIEMRLEEKYIGTIKDGYLYTKGKKFKVNIEEKS